MKESDLFLPAKSWIADNYICNEIYAEVLNCDLLALSGAANIIVELKTTLSFKVIEQAIDRKMYGHYIYVAVPRKKSLSKLAKNILKENGIGLLFIENDKAIRIIPARFNRVRNRIGRDIRSYIKPFHANEIGGVKGGEGNSEYKIMINDIKLMLKSERRFSTCGGWVTVSEILETCETYYSNPRQQVIQTLQESWNQKWCESRKNGRIREFRYKEGYDDE
ncbi:hypothetical protein AOA01_00220 [Listeria monocytogenes]|uniref:hypothetical protein n=1 Tax=Listeria monocytogenes TaxID=1639 RepID=UPI00077563C8|nr:hypothetical protein [Listeria monocytogenes]EAF5877603.1 hypothetical protein [Listeria monocytogenes]KXS65772.1 hypothetical protein AWJ02_01575 [Listeria monocytogenes]KXW92927.1 hypothetical protein AWJ00_08330 [Listeria monocytogenes]